MLEQRLAICPHCGDADKKTVRVLEDKHYSGIDGKSHEVRNLYTCATCEKQYEYYWMWHGEKIVAEEVVKIEWRLNEQTFHFMEFRQVTHSDLWNERGE